ncbi:hypothetical protein F5Y10DRAFT_258736 [Nemania abortiva]|nr:hypothetical protein F5Y10DRAFT_258736 [Nemania abortiva]
MSTYDPADEAFDAAKKSFRHELNDKKLYDDIIADSDTMDDVYQTAAKLQEDAASKASMRHLGRWRPFLDVLAGYGQVIEVFVQVKPEILALVWGPIRLILKWSSELMKALDAMAEVTLKIAQALPQFSELVKVFPDNARMKAALALFYGDILHFYRVILKLFRISRWRLFWETLWNQNKQEIDEIVKKIAEHALLMRNEVSVAEIVKADQARARFLAHFKAVQQFQELQKFQCLRTRLNPLEYGDRLDWIRNRVHEGSPKWMLQDKVFQEWLDMSKKEATWLWVQGIPGSGKTYLAAAAVDEAAIQHQTLYVFASYDSQNITSALAITQSLVFQAAAENQILQAIVVGFSERDLASDGRKALELLKSLLIASTGTCIIVDGLDEIEELERRILLQRLDDLVDECSELKILICSRPEDDITKAMSKKSRHLRIDQRNMASIQRYVNHKTQEWMALQDFDQQTASEISGLLSPLAARANGMFLYARIVLDNLAQLSTIEEIQRELKALPTDMNAAYRRALSKIYNLQPLMQERALKVLGWIGCAPTPMTTLEIEQALSIDASTEEIPSIISSVNFLKLCGPIVEIVNDKLQFVHFTVKEYIFSPQIDGSIRTKDANETLAIANLNYLCSGIRDLDSADSDSHIRRSILAGDYRLLDYAAWYWADLTLIAAQNADPCSIITGLISRAASEVENYDFKPDEESFKPKIEDNALKRLPDQGRDMLIAACRFRRDERQFDWTTTNADTWVNLDPTATSKIVVRVKQCFELLLCSNDTHDDASAQPCRSDCRRAALQRHYGPHFYKCPYFSCPYSRRGFVSRQARDDHEKVHGRPWKCPFTSCQFSMIGFRSQHRKDIHVKRFHQDESALISTVDADRMASSDFDNLDEHEAQPLLFILVRADNTEAVQRLLVSSSGRKIKPDALAAARASAARQGSMAMTQLLTLEGKTPLPVSIVIYAVQSEDVEFAKWGLSRANRSDINTRPFNKLMLRTASDEIHLLWVAILKRPYLVGMSLFGKAVFNDVKDNPLWEERLALTWRLLMDESHFRYQIMSASSRILVALASSTMSATLGKTFLTSCGEDACGSTFMKNSKKAALEIAVKKSTREAAEFMKILIEHHALVCHYEGGLPQRLPYEGWVGPKGIQKWLGITWRELIDQTWGPLKD